MDYQLKGKLAYVSAGAHGIGEAIADLLTQEGAEVIVADADADVLRQKAGKWRGSIAADLATADGVNTATAYALRQFGRAPDILINNLGVGNSTPFEETSDEMWAQSFQVNLMGTVRTCRALVPKMAARGRGFGREHRVGSCEAAGARLHGVRLVQSRAPVFHQGAREAVRAGGARQHGAARARSGRACGRGREASSIISSSTTGSIGMRR